MKTAGIIAAVAIVCAVIAAAFFLNSARVTVPEAPAVIKEDVTIGWKKDFTNAEAGARPDGWKVATKPGTKAAEFLVDTESGKNSSYLRMTADKASASLVTNIDGVDITKTPVLRWRWRARTLPERADGRIKAADDQAIGIYVGEGNPMNNKSVSYRWDTETPKGSEGNVVYGLGGIKVKWFTVRNKEDASNGLWYVEERNVAEDFKRAWGHYPEKIYLTVSCNSQYTRSSAAADLDWVELVSVAKD